MANVALLKGDGPIKVHIVWWITAVYLEKQLSKTHVLQTASGHFEK